MGKVILPYILVQPTIINIDSQLCSYYWKNYLTFLVRHHFHSTFFGNTKDCTHPKIIQDWINDSSIKQCSYFLFHNILHSLGRASITATQTVFFLPKWDLVHAIRRTNNFNIGNCPSHSFLVLSQNLQYFFPFGMDLEQMRIWYE